MENTLIIVPTYNEIENIESLIEMIFENDLPLDVLVVD
jgi:dolichol-phosphate mannosyltransferase